MNAAPDKRKPDLLIVDDDPLISDTLCFVLSRDFSVCVAGSREQARSVLRQLGRPPQLALVDLGLPPSPHRPDEGFRLIAELVAYAPEMKIVVLSGQSEGANARHARTLGAVDFVAKPADPLALKQLLLQALQASNAEKSAAPGVSLLGNSMPVEKLRRQIAQFAASPRPRRLTDTTRQAHYKRMQHHPSALYWCCRGDQRCRRRRCFTWQQWLGCHECGHQHRPSRAHFG